MSAVHGLSDFVPGLTQVVEELEVEVAGRNATIQYQDEGVDVSTKGAIDYVDFTGAGVTVSSPVAGVLQVTIPGGGGSGLTQPQVMARTLGC